MERNLGFALTLLALAPVAVGSSASAQLQQRTYSTRTSKNLGTYHVATDSWTRPGRTGGAANIVAGASLYDNTCLPSTGGVNSTIQTAFNEINGDTGHIPGPSNNFLTFDQAALANSYTVQGWRWAICPAEPSAPGLSMTAIMFHFDRLDSCLFGNSLGAAVPKSAIGVTGLPTGPLGTTCYVFNVDIENTSLEFDINADGDQVYDNPGVDGGQNDSFGLAVWLQRSDGAAFQTTIGNAIGLGGNKFGPPLPDCNGGQGFVGESTSFFMPTTAIDTATGLGQFDAIEAIGGTTPGCYNFGHAAGLNGNPWAGLYHELYGVPAGAPPPMFVESCNGDGGNQLGCTDCLCGNNGAPGTVGGCTNADSRNARLLGSGTPSVSSDTLRFEMTGGTSSSFAVLTSGGAIAPNNPGNPCFGLDSGIQAVTLDGLRCAVQAVQRHGSRSIDANGDVGTGIPGPGNQGWGPPSGPPGGLALQGGFGAGQTRHYQVIYRVDPLLGCMTGQNTSQAVTVLFQP